MLSTPTLPPSPAPAGRSSRALRAQATRQHLIDTTIRVLHERGYADATLFEVAKAAGVTPGALQHHFGSRAVLMLEVLGSILASGALDQPLAALDHGQPLAQRAERFVAVLWTQLYAPPRFLAAWGVYFGAAGDAGLKPRMAEMRRRLSGQLHQRFLRSFPEAASQPDRQAFFDLVLASLRGIAMARLFELQPRREAAQRAALARLIAAWCETAAKGQPARPSATARRTPKPRPGDLP